MRGSTPRMPKHTKKAATTLHDMWLRLGFGLGARFRQPRRDGVGFGLLLGELGDPEDEFDHFEEQRDTNIEFLRDRSVAGEFQSGSGSGRARGPTR